MSLFVRRKSYPASFSASFGASPLNGITTDVASTALFARMAATGTAVDATHQTAIDTLIKALKSSGIWAKLDVFQMYAAQTQGHSLLNWVSSSFPATAVLAPTFTADRGFAGNGSTSYLDTGFNPTTGGLLSSLNNASFALWHNGAAAFTYLMWIIDSPKNTEGYTQSATTVAIDINSTDAAADVFTGAVAFNGSQFGLIAGTRPDASNIFGYVNGVSRGSFARASNAIPNLNFFLGGRNISGGIANNNTTPFSMFAYGSALSATDQTNLNTAIRVYMTALGN